MPDLIPPFSVFDKGDGPMSYFVTPPEGVSTYKLVYLRVHFRLKSGSNVDSNLVISLDSSLGDEYDVSLYTVFGRGVGSDVNLVFTSDELSDPSPWVFGNGDRLLLSWDGPTGVSWGAQVGIQY